MENMTVSADQYLEILAAQFKISDPSKRIIPLLESEPGQGKTSLHVDFCRQNNIVFRDFRVNTRQMEDFTAIPVVTTLRAGEIVEYTRAEILGPKTEQPTLLFIDELDKSFAPQQNALLGVFQERRMHDEYLADSVVIACAGNTVASRAGGMKLTSAIDGRTVNMTYRVDLDQWSRTALSKGFRPEVVAFNRFKHNDNTPCLNAFNPQERASPTPRTWEQTSNILNMHLPFATEAAAITGAIGRVHAVQFCAFLRLWRELPSIDGILRNPDSETVDFGRNTAQILYAVCNSLASRCNLQVWPNIAKYLNRLAPTFQVYGYSLCKHRCPEIKETAHFVSWAIDNQSVMF